MANLDADPLNMSLDDLIEKHREKGQKAKSAGGRRQSGGRGGRGRGSRETRGQGGGSNPTFVLNNTRNRAISKRPGRTARAGLLPPLPTAERNQAALNGNEAWDHDMYREDPRPRQRPRPTREDGTQLNLSNLDYKVTNDDIQELFETVGPVKRSGINYDASDRADGTAYVVFQNRDDALQAIKRYNNVALDGKPMQISLGKPSTGNQVLSSGISVGGGSRIATTAFSRAVLDAQGSAGGIETGSRVQGGMRSDRMTGNVRRQPARGPQRTHADLDADIDVYMQG